MSPLTHTVIQQLCQAAILGYLDCIRMRGNHLMTLYNMCKENFSNINSPILCQLDAHGQYYSWTDNLVGLEKVNVSLSQA